MPVTPTSLSPIERALLSSYYESNTVTGDTSSHWCELGSRFRVGVDDRGGLKAEGLGFGACHWNGWLSRVFDTSTVLAHLAQLPARSRLIELRRASTALARAAGLDPTFDVFRQVCTVQFLETFVEQRTSAERFLLIGDGYGMLGALLKTRFPKAQVVFVDLGRTLLFQAHHVPRALPQYSHGLVEQGSVIPSTDFVYCPSDQVDQLTGLGVDVAVNVASMQEMAPEVVTSYFTLLRQTLRPRNLFYCCNRERKEMPGGEISEFQSYPWESADTVLVDGRCPWHQYFLAVHPTASFPRLLGIPVPFIRYYDGPHWHRLAIMAARS